MRGESVGFHWFFPGLCSHIKKKKKRLRGAANYRPNFLDILVPFFLLFFMAAPICSVALKEKGTATWQPPQLSTAIATAEPPWVWSWAGPRWLQPATHLWRRAVFKLGK